MVDRSIGLPGEFLPFSVTPGLSCGPMQYIIVAVLYTVVWITERRNPTIMLGSGGGRGRGGECARSVSYSGYSSIVSRYTTNFIQ